MGESSFIIDALKYAITEYSDITIASIDIILSDIDPVCKDLYVLSLTEENGLTFNQLIMGRICIVMKQNLQL